MGRAEGNTRAAIPEKTVTAALGAIPGTRQVLADLRGALPGDSMRLTACASVKERFLLEIPPNSDSLWGRGLLAGDTHQGQL